MDLFKRERELCLLFKSRYENNKIKIDCSLSNKGVDILVFHDGNEWDIQKSREEVDSLWMDFNLAFIIGYKPKCNVNNYRHESGSFVTDTYFQ